MIFRPSSGDLADSTVSGGAMSAGAAVAAAGLASGETADGAGLDRVAWTPAVSSLRDVSCVTRVGDVAVEWPSASLACGSINHMAQPAMAMAGSTASRASAFPNDHPAILIAASSPGSVGDRRAPHEKSLTGVSRTASVTTAAVRIPPPVNNHPGQKWFHATSTILRRRRDRDGIADARRLHWPRRDRP